MHDRRQTAGRWSLGRVLAVFAFWALVLASLVAVVGGCVIVGPYLF